MKKYYWTFFFLNNVWIHKGKRSVLCYGQESYFTNDNWPFSNKCKVYRRFRWRSFSGQREDTILGVFVRPTTWRSNLFGRNSIFIVSFFVHKIHFYSKIRKNIVLYHFCPSVISIDESQCSNFFLLIYFQQYISFIHFRLVQLKKWNQRWNKTF